MPVKHGDGPMHPQHCATVPPVIGGSGGRPLPETTIQGKVVEISPSTAPSSATRAELIQMESREASTSQSQSMHCRTAFRNITQHILHHFPYSVTYSIAMPTQKARERPMCAPQCPKIQPAGSMLCWLAHDGMLFQAAAVPSLELP